MKGDRYSSTASRSSPFPALEMNIIRWGLLARPASAALPCPLSACPARSALLDWRATPADTLSASLQLPLSGDGQAPRAVKPSRRASRLWVHTASARTRRGAPRRRAPLLNGMHAHSMRSSAPYHVHTEVNDQLRRNANYALKVWCTSVAAGPAGGDARACRLPHIVFVSITRIHRSL